MAGKCPFLAGQQAVNERPQSLNLSVLSQWKGDGLNSRAAYLEQFQQLDVKQVKADIVQVLTTSQPWWPADYGHYGPFMVRLAWHSAGTYRAFDGRGGANGGNIRLNPLDSWPDNGNLDKAKRLLWPVKQRYGQKLSWADLILLSAEAGMEDMGFRSFGFSGGRVDTWAQEKDVYWGLAESFQGLAQTPDALEAPLGAIVQSLIYVNPEGPDGIPDPLLAAGHIKTTFSRMGVDYAETVALIAGGHTFGKCHGAAPGGKHQGPCPREAAIAEQGFGWTSDFGTGKGGDAITSGLEGAWTAQPAKWDHGYFTNLFQYEWELYEGPGGAKQWRPQGGLGNGKVPLAHGTGTTHPIMLTTDLSLRMDPEFAAISKTFLEDPELFHDAFARAWFKLTHRDMGPKRRYVGALAPIENLVWQDNVAPASAKGAPMSAPTQAALKAAIERQGVSCAELVHTAWANASTFRHTDFRGGANGARIALEPCRSWAANAGCASVLAKLEAARAEVNAGPAAAKGEYCSLADAIVLGGNLAIEQAATKAGMQGFAVGFSPGRGEAAQEGTDPLSFAYLEPKQDAFRNFGGAQPAQLVDKAHLLGLNPREMVVLLAGMRTLGANGPGVPVGLGVFTNSVGVLDNAWVRNLTDMQWAWALQADGETFVGSNRETGAAKWTGSAADLCLGSNPELRAVCEHYACDDAAPQFAADFAKAWQKVMENDMYDGKWE